MKAPEAEIQRSIIAYLRTILPHAIVHHSASEGVRGGRAGLLDGAKRKGMGQVPGWPDIIVLPFAHVGPILFEVKSQAGRVSPEQRDMHDRLEALGYRVAVVRSIDQVRQRLADWGVWTQERGAV